MSKEIEALVQPIGLLRCNSSKLAKERILLEYANLPGFKDFLKFIYNPYVKTGIAQLKLEKGICNAELKGVDVTVQYIIDYFTAHRTGSGFDIQAAWAMINSQVSDDAKWLVKAMITQKLSIGVTETTLNNVYGADFIPKIGVMLAEQYKDNKQKVQGPFIVTEKLDGHRRILIKQNGVAMFYTRSGLPDETPINLGNDIAYLPDNMVYDGEFLAIGNFQDSIELRIATASIMSQKGTKCRHGVIFNVFDMLPISHYLAGKSESAFNRKIDLCKVFGDESIFKLTGNNVPLQPNVFSFIKAVPILGVATTEDEILTIAKPIWDRRFEGVMLNTFNGKYVTKRTKALLKVKHTEEYTLKVIDFEEGTGKYEGALGALVVDYKGNALGVGTGFTDAMRHTYWLQRDSLLGKSIEVDSFGESKDKNGIVSLNCPVFKRFAKED